MPRLFPLLRAVRYGLRILRTEARFIRRYDAPLSFVRQGPVRAYRNRVSDVFTGERYRMKDAKRRKVAILGAGPSRREAPWSDPTWEMWGLGRFWTWMPRWDLWFEMHQLSIFSAEEVRALVQTVKVPIYMKQRYPSIPLSRRYPIELVSRGHARLFTCTVCYELALAIHQGVAQIGLYGVDLDLDGDTPREHTVERMGVAYWVGVARGRGITVDVAGTVLTHPYLYGLQYWAEVRHTRRLLAGLKQQLRTTRDDFDVPRVAKRISAAARRIAAAIP